MIEGILHMEASVTTSRRFKEETAAVAMIVDEGSDYSLMVAVVNAYATSGHGEKAARRAIRWWEETALAQMADLSFRCREEDAVLARLAEKLGFDPVEGGGDGVLHFVYKAKI